MSECSGESGESGESGFHKFTNHPSLKNDYFVVHFARLNAQLK
jgi:hypothetical protein